MIRVEYVAPKPKMIEFPSECRGCHFRYSFRDGEVSYNACRLINKAYGNATPENGKSKNCPLKDNTTITVKC